MTLKSRDRREMFRWFKSAGNGRPQRYNRPRRHQRLKLKIANYLVRLARSAE